MRTKKDKPTAEPLTVKVRAALATDWRTLAALDTLTAARGSDARRLVHEALRALRGCGVVLEERVGRAGVEVRLSPATLPAPMPDDGQPGDLSPEDIEAIRASLLDADDREAARGAVEQAAWERAHDPRAEDACPECEEIHPADDRHDGPFTPNLRWPSPPVEGEPVDAASYYLGRGRDVEDEPDDYTRVHAALAAGRAALDAPAPPVDQAVPVEAVGGPVAREPGPSSRCAVCGERYHGHGSEEQRGHPFTPKPRGRPRARLAAAQAADPDVEELPTAGEQKAILDGMREQWDAAVVEHRAERAAAEPETSRGGSPGEQGHGEQEQSEATDVGTNDDGAEGERARSRAAGSRQSSRIGTPRDDEGVSGEDQRAGGRAPRRSGKAVEPVGLKPPRCTPPHCHADDIHEPSRVRSFARPLCEAHQRWVEGAGGTVAGAGDVAALATD